MPKTLPFSSLRKAGLLLAASLGLVVLVGPAAQAQLSTYSFAQAAISPAYTTLTGGTQLSAQYNIAGLQFNGASTVTYGSNSTAPGEGFPIGFSFKLGTQTYDRFAINASGWISLGKSSDGSSAVTALFQTGNTTPIGTTNTGPTNVIAGFTANLATGTAGSLRYVLTGTAPNRSLVVQWNACGISGNETAPGYYTSNNSFQIVLDETTNVVRLRYGTIDNSRVGIIRGQAGLRGATNADFIARATSNNGDWLNWIQSYAATSVSDYLLSASSVVSSGVQYTFTPPTCGSPTGAAISSVTTTSASLSFTPSGYGGAYTVQLTPQGGTATTVTTTATSSPVALTNLTPGTTYSVAVSASCTTANLTSTYAGFTTLVPNDECSTAAVLPVGTTCTNTVVNTLGGTASASVPATTCNSYNSSDVWYSLTVPASGGVLLTTSAYSGSPVTDGTYLGVYSGTCGSLTPVACNTPNTGTRFASVMVTGRTPGSTLWVRLRSITINASSQVINGRFNLCAVATIPNDECATAAPLPVTSACTNTLVNTALANASVLVTPRGSCYNITDPDAWYSVTVPASGALTVSTSAVAGSSVASTYLYVYYGGCGNPILVGCQSGSGFAAVSVRNQTPGDVLLVRVQAANSTAGPFNICATAAPDNDEPGQAVALPFGTSCTSVNGNNYNATTTIPKGYVNGSTCGGNTAPRDVWYSFRTSPTGTGPQTVRIVVSGGAAGLVRVFSATSGNGPFTPVDCSVGLGGNTAAPPLRMTSLVANTQYFVSVSDRSGSDATGTFTICAQDQTVLASRTALAGGEVHVYPNPASRRCVLSLPALGTIRLAEVQVLNALGQVVLTQAVATTAAGTESSLDIAALPAGLYSVQVRAGTELATVRLVVQ